jgi:uncharacterized protein (AIM24 family)
MAKFEVLNAEGIHFVKITIENEMVQAERGALCWMTGGIVMDAKLPFVGRAITSYLSEEAFVRPTYTGTGEIYLESSFGGFHVIDIMDEAWILENGVYWSSEGSVRLTVQREKMWTLLWAGEGLIDWQTKLTGRGKAVLSTPGPVDHLSLEKGQRVVANGKYILGRTAEVAYRIQRPTKSLIGAYVAGEGYCRFYEGPGHLLLSATPYWRYRLFAQRAASPSQVAAVE